MVGVILLPHSEDHSTVWILKKRMLIAKLIAMKVKASTPVDNENNKKWNPIPRF